MANIEQQSLYELRKKNRLSQIGTAAVLGVHINTYISWERGVSNPSPEFAERLDALFGTGTWRVGA